LDCHGKLKPALNVTPTALSAFPVFHLGRFAAPDLADIDWNPAFHEQPLV